MRSAEPARHSPRETRQLLGHRVVPPPRECTPRSMQVSISRASHRSPLGVGSELWNPESLDAPWASSYHPYPKRMMLPRIAGINSEFFRGFNRHVEFDEENIIFSNSGSGGKYGEHMRPEPGAARECAGMVVCWHGRIECTPVRRSGIAARQQRAAKVAKESGEPWRFFILSDISIPLSIDVRTRNRLVFRLRACPLRRCKCPCL